MAIIDFIKPYDCDKMKYNYDLSRYVLNLSHSKDRTGIDLIFLWKTEENAELYLSMISDVVDTYIASFKKSEYYDKLKYYLSHSKKMREAVYELMVDTVRYNFKSGGFLIAYETGINLSEMKEIRMKLENAMSVIGEGIAVKYGLKNRSFRYTFDVIESQEGNRW